MKSEKGQNEIARSIYEGDRRIIRPMCSERAAPKRRPQQPRSPVKSPKRRSSSEGAVRLRSRTRHPMRLPRRPSPGKRGAGEGCGQVRGAETGPRKPAKAGDDPETSRPAAALYRAGAGQRADRADLVRTFQSLPQQGETVYAEGRFRYKYCVGEYDTRAAAQKRLAEVRKVFPDAFVVCCRGTQIVK